MRALLEGRRQAGVGVVAGLLGVICLLVASAGLNLRHVNDLRDVKRTLIGRCELRQHADDRERADLQARIDLYSALLATEHGPRAAAYRRAMDAAQGTLDGLPPPVDCSRVYASSAD